MTKTKCRHTRSTTSDAPSVSTTCAGPTRHTRAATCVDVVVLRTNGARTPDRRAGGTGDEIGGQGWSPECRDYVQTREADDDEHPLEEDPPEEEDHLPDIVESEATEPPPQPESEVSESETLHIDESNTTDPPPSPESMSEHVDKDSEHYVDVSEATDPPPEPESEDSHEEEQEHYQEQPEDYLSHDYHQEVKRDSQI
jgi:hypothetical protein